MTGFLFGESSLKGLSGAIRRAFDVFASKRRLGAMRRNAMSREFGWDQAADGYSSLYTRVVGNGGELMRARAVA